MKRHTEDLVIHVRRYDKPDVRVGIHHYEREPRHRLGWSPITAPRLVSETQAKAAMAALITQDYEKVALDMDDQELVKVVQFSLPIEFHRQFHAQDPAVIDRIEVYAR